MRIEALLRPKSIAIIGASEKPTIGRRLIASLERIGFAGAIFPVNPNYSTVLGRRCYPSIADTPEVPEAAAFCVGHRLVLDPLKEAAERGIQAAIVYDGGFAERGPEGKRRQDQIVGICREAGIALCGPNCMGVLNPHDRSTTYLQELRDPAGLAGNVGIVSQSGAICISLLTDIRRFGFSHVVSSGNEAVLVMADYLEYLVNDPKTQVIGGFIETVRSPDRFVAVLDRAASQGKPVVALKVGRTERTRRAVTTHTGGVAGEPGFLSELLLDIAASADLLLPPLSAAAKAEIESRIGFVTGDGNPLDAWGNGTFVANLPLALGVFDRSPDHDIVVFCRDNCDDQPFEIPELPWSYLELFIRSAASSSKPHYLLHTRPGVMNRKQVAHLRAAGIPVVGGIREGLGAIDRLARGAV